MDSYLCSKRMQHSMETFLHMKQLFKNVLQTYNELSYPELICTYQMGEVGGPISKSNIKGKFIISVGKLVVAYRWSAVYSKET